MRSSDQAPLLKAVFALREVRIEGNADPLVVRLIRIRVVLDPGREKNQATRARLDVDGAAFGHLVGRPVERACTRPRIHQEEIPGIFFAFDIVDAAENTPRMHVNTNEIARRLDVGPSACDGGRNRLGNIVGPRTLADHLADGLEDFVEGLPLRQIMRGLPARPRVFDAMLSARSNRVNFLEQMRVESFEFAARRELNLVHMRDETLIPGPFVKKNSRTHSVT